MRLRGNEIAACVLIALGVGGVVTVSLLGGNLQDTMAAFVTTAMPVPASSPSPTPQPTPAPTPVPTPTV